MAGKGSKQRPLSIPGEQYRDNWDAIFKKKKIAPKPEPVKKDCSETNRAEK